MAPIEFEKVETGEKGTVNPGENKTLQNKDDIIRVSISCKEDDSGGEVSINTALVYFERFDLKDGTTQEFRGVKETIKLEENQGLVISKNPTEVFVIKHKKK